MATRLGCDDKPSWYVAGMRVSLVFVGGLISACGASGGRAFDAGLVIDGGAPHSVTCR